MNIQKRHCGSRGFTLVELMIVVSIIGILAGVGVPEFATMLRRSREASTKGALLNLRSALTIYISDNSVSPCLGNDGDVVTAKKLTMLIPAYLENLPPVKLVSYHPDRNEIVVRSSAVVNQTTIASESDTSGWIYSSWSGGSIFINCAHTDSKNLAYAAW